MKMENMFPKAVKKKNIPPPAKIPKKERCRTEKFPGGGRGGVIQMGWGGGGGGGGGSESIPR